MARWRRDEARHVLMRAGLGFALGWFGTQELRAPSEWTVFVPSFVTDHTPIAVNNLVLGHGFLLLLASVSIVAGLVYVGGCLLAIGLIAEVVVNLWFDGSSGDLVVRDIGLLGLASALALDPARRWHVDHLLARMTARRVVAGRRSTPRSERRPRLAYGASGSILLVSVLGLGSLLYFTGRGTEDLSVSVSDSLASSGAPSSAQASGGATPRATPAANGEQLTSTRFDAWRYKRYAYQLYPGEPSSQTKTALAGFDLSVAQNGDKAQVLLKAQSSRYHDVTMSVDKRDTVYFIETSIRDDPGGRENQLSDDGVIAVSPDGFILKPQ